MKILHVLDHSIPIHDGYSFRTLSILKEQRRRGWETFHVTSPKHYGAKGEIEDVDGFRFFRTVVPSVGLRNTPIIGQAAVIYDTYARVAEVIRQVRPDVVHAHSPCLNGIAALRAARAARIPFVYEVRAFWEDAAVDQGTTVEGSLRYRATRAMETWVLKHADCVTTICDGLKADILARGVPGERITVIPNAVDVERFPFIYSTDAVLRHQLGLDGAVTLGFLGSFYGYEGLDTLLDAMDDILVVEPKARLLLVGGGYEDGRLQERARRLGISDRVVFAGRVPHFDITRYYSLVDILVFPRKSIRLTETVTPLKPLEAMAQGRLVIASDVGGHRELVEDGKTGFLFEPNRPQAIADAVGRVRALPDHGNQIRHAARAFVERERTWQASVGRYVQVYASAVGRARSI